MINKAFSIIIRDWTCHAFFKLSISERKSNFWIRQIEIGFRPTLQCPTTLQRWAKEENHFQSTAVVTPLTSSTPTSFTNLRLAELARQTASNYTEPPFFCNFTVIILIWTCSLVCKNKKRFVSVSWDSELLNMCPSFAPSGFNCSGFGRFKELLQLLLKAVSLVTLQ